MSPRGSRSSSGFEVRRDLSAAADRAYGENMPSDGSSGNMQFGSFLESAEVPCLPQCLV